MNTPSSGVQRLPILIFFYFFLPGTTAAKPLGKYGRLLDSFLESLHVEQYWIAGAKVNWKTGIPSSTGVTSKNYHSHCSAFVAAACYRLGIYIVRPPEHGLLFLANAQYTWLQQHGCEEGWFAVNSGTEAQELANQGFLVVAAYKQPPPELHGHIAIVRPSSKEAELIKLEGPDIIQAGKTNYSLTSLANGFKAFDDAFNKKEIKFFAHFIPHAQLLKFQKEK